MLGIYRGINNSKDVSDIIKDLLSKSKSFIVSNNHFGDIEPGVKKWLEIEGEIYYEGDIYSTSHKQKLGIFYSNNQLDQGIFDAVIRQLETIKNIDIITCCKKKLDNSNFINLQSRVEENSHFAIAVQILQCLTYANRIGSYKTVSLLEHDVLYHSSHFNYQPFKGVICNMNYEGKNKQGWQGRDHNHEPLHQITMEFNVALEYFKDLVVKYIGNEEALLEPNELGITRVEDDGTSIHINHDRNFTSHYSIYSKNTQTTHKNWNNDLSERTT